MRVQLELDESASQIISQIKTVAGYEKMSYREFFDIAIGFLNWGAKQVQSGRIIAAVDENANSYTEVITPLFDRIHERSTSKKGQGKGIGVGVGV